MIMKVGYDVHLTAGGEGDFLLHYPMAFPGWSVAKVAS